MVFGLEEPFGGEGAGAGNLFQPQEVGFFVSDDFTPSSLDLDNVCLKQANALVSLVCPRRGV